MPILARETHLYPEDLLVRSEDERDTDHRWWALYSLPRREKQLMRRLHALKTPFFGPLVAKRTRQPNGRVRTSHIPLFPGYVFLFGDNTQRHAAMTTNCVSRYLEVPNGGELRHDLQRIHQLIESGEPLTPEARIEPGRPVRIRSGVFAGMEGVVIRRANETRLVVAVNFLQRGASVQVDDCQVELSE